MRYVRRRKDFLLMLLRVANLRHVLHLLLVLLVVLRGGVIRVLVIPSRALHWVALLLLLSIWVAVLSRIGILTRLGILL